mmetsp:Transcript_12028/g.26040  ORF Transcript_12028/g.26040 Transcript_12028/m.26040 type:complete len:224 (-) Transcript_12028:933-1604(-)
MARQFAEDVPVQGVANFVPIPLHHELQAEKVLPAGRLEQYNLLPRLIPRARRHPIAPPQYFTKNWCSGIYKHINFLRILDSMTQCVGMAAARLLHLERVPQIDLEGTEWYARSISGHFFLNPTIGLRGIIHVEIEGLIAKRKRIVGIGSIGFQQQYVLARASSDQALGRYGKSSPGVWITVPVRTHRPKHGDTVSIRILTNEVGYLAMRFFEYRENMTSHPPQ